MKQVNIYDAKTHFSKLMEEVQAGKEITVAKNGKPIAEIIPSRNKNNRRLGAWANNPNVMIPDDFDDLDPEIMEMFENSRIFPDGNV